MNGFTLLLLYVAMIALVTSKSSLADGDSPANSPHLQARARSPDNPTNPNSDKSPVFSTQDITNGIDAQFDGVLIIKSEQTSCQVVLVTDAYGFVAANCLMIKDKVVSSLQDMQVAVRGPKLSAIYPITNVTIHPKYDATTLANNIAVIKYTSPNNSGIKGKLAATTTNWKQLGYLRRTLSDVPKLIWNEPTHLVTSQDEDAKCSLGSPVFSANRKSFICSNSTTKVPVSGSCSLPYGLVYGVVKPNKIAPAAIYSHTVVFGEGLCSNFMKLNYYVQLGNYMSWGAQVSGSKIKAEGKDKNKGKGNDKEIDDDNDGDNDNASERKLHSDPTFSMKGGGSSVPGVAVYGGNLFALIPDSKPKPPGGDPKPTKPSVITVTTIRTVYITRNTQPPKQSEWSTTLIINPVPSTPTTATRTTTDVKSKPTKDPIPNISEVTKLPIPTDSPDDPDSDSDTDADTKADSDSDKEDGSSNTKPPTDKEKLKSTEGMSSKTKVLIGVLVGLAVLGIGAFSLYYFYYRRRQ
ncbi:hypothetical protein IWW37_003385 [Coemansia sp. RSA 2050]|nr:hypothetical protein IWW37_003385 [Coemansia sp. RSA 2050]KAJ2732408.1 hypothetical protein IW152_003803 [Coemansia sp. BCRC 34962]